MNDSRPVSDRSRWRAAVLALIAAIVAVPAAAQISTPTFTATAVPTLTPTFTSTSVPATSTQTFTATSLPATRTPTATFTSTSLPFTSTQTFTATSLPATRTPTATFTSTNVPFTSTRTFTATSVPSTPTQTATFTSTNLPATPTRTPTFTPTIGFGLSINDVSILEGADGTRSAVFVVRLRGPRTYPVSVNAKTADKTATAASDYDPLSATLVFNSFENEKTVSVTVRGDRIREGDETFTVTLSGAVGAPLGDAVGVGTILDDDNLGVGVPELRPADPVTAPNELTTLTLGWVHPERWRALNTVDLRLVDGDRPVFWVRFEEAAGTFAVCNAKGRCSSGVPPGAGAPITRGAGTFYPAESAVQGSGPTGPSVDLVIAFSLDLSLGGRVLRVETAATDDSGAEQGFLPIASLEVIDTSSDASGADGDSSAIQRRAGADAAAGKC